MTSNKNNNQLQSSYCKSVFTLSFAIEVLGIDVWHDCNEGFVELGPCAQGIKVQYQLYPGQNYDLDVLVWPHVAKIWCGGQYGWVRVWQFLEKRWLTFSIQHAFPVRVSDLRMFTATVSIACGFGSLSANAKGDQNVQVYLPTLSFGETRYFAPVLPAEPPSLVSFVEDLVWLTVEKHIPETHLDHLFDCPCPVTDVRHQDSIIFRIREAILNENVINTESNEGVSSNNFPTSKDSKSTKEKPKSDVKTKFEIILPGDSLLAGVGRVIAFNEIGDKPQELGRVIALVSSTYLPAPDDVPILFVNVDKLFDAPFDGLTKARINKIYIQWHCGDTVHASQPLEVRRSRKEINFADHCPLPLPYDVGSEVLASFLDNSFNIELRGIREINITTESPKLFGYLKCDREFDREFPPAQTDPETDVLIAICKIDLISLAKGINGVVQGEYPLLPPKSKVSQCKRELFCTNDVNAIRMKTMPDIIVPASVVLEAQMTLEVSIGLVGCRHAKLPFAYSRLYSIVVENNTAMALLTLITEINGALVAQGSKKNVLTGCMVDTGDVVFLFVEGPRDKQMMSVWELTGDLDPKMRTVFSTAAKYSSRIYADFLYAAVPFLVLKMFVPLSVVLACPQIYARPALPLPTKSAVLKLGSLIAAKLVRAPLNDEMPTVAELRSLRVELCTPKKPVQTPVETKMLKMPSCHAETSNIFDTKAKINWNT